MFWSKSKPVDMAAEHHKRAIGLLADGQAEEAQAEFEAALEVDGERMPTLLGLARLHLDAGRHEAALPLCQRALKLDAAHVEASVLVARAYGLQGKYDWAVGQLRRTLLIDPDCLEAMELLRELNAQRLALTPGEEGSLRSQQTWAISEYHQIRKTVARQSRLGWRLRQLFKRPR
jgi:tetratricopeptide (TPR) repeat protein